MCKVNKMYPLHHRKCGNLLFYYKEKPKVGLTVEAELSVNARGEQPLPGQDVFCIECGGFVQTFELGSPYLEA